MNFLFIIFFIFPNKSPCALDWSAKDRSLYNSRHFLELTHLLIMQKREGLRKKMTLQEKDLAGCRSIHRGHGGVYSLVACMRFVDREDEMGLFTTGRKQVISDLNLLCQTLATKP